MVIDYPIASNDVLCGDAEGISQLVFGNGVEIPKHMIVMSVYLRRH